MLSFEPCKRLNCMIWGSYIARIWSCLVKSGRDAGKMSKLA